MSLDEQSLEEELACMGQELKPQARWMEQVWRRIGMDPEPAQPSTPAVVLPLFVAREERKLVELPRPASAAPPARAAAREEQPTAERHFFMAALAAAGGGLAVAAMVAMLLIVRSQSALAEKNTRIAASEMVDLQREIDVRLREIDLTHEQGSAAFRRVFYAKGDAERRASETEMNSGSPGESMRGDSEEKRREKAASGARTRKAKTSACTDAGVSRCPQ